MSNLYLQLLKNPANHAALNPASAYIALKKNSVTTISAECRSPREVEEAAEWLINELKTIKKQAVTFFEKERKKITDEA